MGRNSTFAYTSPREKLGLIQNILRQLYEAPTRGNNGKGDLYLASISQGQIADALHVDRSTISRIFGDPRMRPHMERYGIARYKDPTAKGTEKRYIFDPSIATIHTNSEGSLTTVVNAAKAMLAPTTSIPTVTNGEDTKDTKKPAGIKLRPDQEKWLEIWANTLEKLDENGQKNVKELLLADNLKISITRKDKDD